MPVRSVRSSRSKRQSKKIEVTPAVLEEMVEVRAEQIVHHQNIFDFKMVVALAVIGIASMAMNTLAITTSTSSTQPNTPVSAITAGKLTVVTKTDYQTSPRIVIPSIIKPVTNPASSTPDTILGKWELKASKEPITLTRMRFSALNPDSTVRVNATEFGLMSLSNANGVLLGTAPFANGYAEFNVSNFVVAPTKAEILVLKGEITGSGVMKENSAIRFGVNLQDLQDGWQAVGTNSAITLSPSNFLFFPKFPGVTNSAASTALLLYHNAVPELFNGFGGWSVYPKSVSDQSKIFATRIDATGEKDLRISKLLITVSVTGMTNNGTAKLSLASASSTSPTSTEQIDPAAPKPSSTSPGTPTPPVSGPVNYNTGIVNGFKLYEAVYVYGVGAPHDNVSLGKLVATSPACLVSPKAGGPQTGVQTMPGVGTCSIGKVILSFNTQNDADGYFDSLIIPTGQNQRYVLVADTTKIKGSGTVTLTGQIFGNKGPWSNVKSNDSLVWASGGVYYHYTPEGGQENSVAYTHSNDYPLVGQAMNFIPPSK